MSKPTQTWVKALAIVFIIIAIVIVVLMQTVLKHKSKAIYAGAALSAVVGVPAAIMWGLNAMSTEKRLY